VVQAPFEQTSFTRQTLPHAPQLAASLVVSVHWPAHTASAPEQPHAATWQVSPLAHETPHAPQFSALELVSTQAAPQRVSAAEHEVAQVPWSHTSPVWQLVAQAPQ
jgi:hypothetical protein